MNCDVCIVGGGPAGVVLALQLAKANVSVVLLESSTTYKRLFRGDSLQPDAVSTLYGLGIGERLRELGSIETHRMEVCENGRVLFAIDYRKQPYRYNYVLDVPQTSLLETLHDELAKYPSCTTIRGAVCTGLLEREGRIEGVEYRKGGVAEQVCSRWVVGADGRFSRVREFSGLKYQKKDLDRDVAWFKVSIPDYFPEYTARVIMSGSRHLILLPTYPNLFRAGINIPKGGFGALKDKGLDAFFDIIDRIDERFGEHVRQYVTDWADVHMLDIFMITMKTWWREGLVLIGDAAHTVGPLLGQGVNLAVHDAISLAPMLAAAPKETSSDKELFGAFQAKRMDDVDTVRRVQVLQEKLLCSESGIVQHVRRLYYKALSTSPLQKFMMGNLIYRHQQALSSRSGVGAQSLPVASIDG